MIKKKILKLNFLSANKNYRIICKQIIKYKPKYFIIKNKLIFNKIKSKFKNNKTIILNDYKFKKFQKSDVIVSAIPGIGGLDPTLNLIKFTKKILIANKESIICGWNLLKKEANKNKTKIIPIDSEHFSILKLLEKEDLKQIKKIYLTASGGPFLNYNKKQLLRVQPRDTLKHPKWKMGKKITVDSATLMNKMFEIVEHKVI